MKCNHNKTREINYHHVIEIKNHIIEFDAPRTLCDECNDLVETDRLAVEATKKLNELYNKKYGITKETIVKLRKSYHLSQELFAKILGCAKKTLVSYETGQSIPNDIYMGLLKLLDNKPSIIIDLLKATKDNYSKSEYDSLIKKVNISAPKDGKKTSDNKLIKSLIAYYAENGVPKTKILVETFATYYEYYRLYGKLLDNNSFYKTDSGLTSEAFEMSLLELLENNIIEMVYDVNGNKEMLYLKTIDFDNELITEPKLTLLVRKIKNDYKLLSAEQMLKELKNNVLYDNTVKNKEINFK